ncbi:MAG: hypothetical protein KFF73_18320 [Cyclobacteriaceae bacterium]|nr:hypothetical protein [Cyclobacteriaceae bacterium]
MAFQVPGKELTIDCIIRENIEYGSSGPIHPGRPTHNATNPGDRDPSGQKLNNH